MKKKYKKIKTFIPILVFTLFFLLFSSPASAATCGFGVPAISVGQVFWGTDAKSSVLASKNDTVQITVVGEDGCAGKNATFHLYDKNKQRIQNVEIKGALVKGDKVGTAGFKLTLSWKVGVDKGEYFARLFRVDGVSGSNFNFSNNLLNITDVEQSCKPSKVSVSPVLTKFGEKVNISIEATGQCNGWESSIVIRNETQRKDESNPPAKQKFGSGSNTLTFQWAPSENPYTKAAKDSVNKNTYRAITNIGKLAKESNQFTYEFIGENAGGAFGEPDDKGKEETKIEKVTVSEEFKPPFAIESFTGLFDKILLWLIRIAVPVGVLMIVFSGILMVTSSGKPEQVNKAKTIFKYAIIGLVIIFIGKGFITLLESILNIGNP